MLGEVADADRAKRFRGYLALTISLIVLALLSFLLVPQGNSLGSCDRLVFTGSRYTCITSLALSQSNVSMCGYTSGSYADSCYSQVAEKTDNVSACGSVRNGTSFSVCVTTVAIAKGDYGSCSGAGEPYASRCEADIAIGLGSASMCAPILNSTYSAECSSIIGIRSAEASGNATYCGSVSASADRNLTNYIILNASSGASPNSLQGSLLLGSLPLMPNSTYTARDYCYIALASETSNALLCSKVSVGAATNACIEQATLASNQNSNQTANFTSLLASCSSAGAYAQQCEQSVILSQAINTKNATLCARLDSAQVTACYSLLASTYTNSTYCGYISNVSAKSSCIANS